MSESDRREALLMVGHGTRDARGTREFFEVVERVRNHLPGVDVQPSFLEIAEPSIARGIEELASRGATQIVAAPVILLAASHVRRDIPSAVHTAASAAQVSVRIAEHLGCHDALLELSAVRFRAAIENCGQRLAERTALIMLGRGSRDETARAEMRRFVDQRVARTPVASVSTAFLALAEPSLADEARRVADTGPSRIVVQPHLLFAGELLERLRRDVARLSQNWPDSEWIVAAHLGDHPLLAEAIASRFRESRFCRTT